MIISHKNRFIFVKTRKTAGTSIEIALSQFCGDDDVITEISKEDELIRAKLGYRGPQNFRYPTPFLNIKYWLKLASLKKAKVSNGQHSPSSFIKSYVGEKIWNSYYKFCFERNPYDKALSLYYWATRKMEPLPDINDFLKSFPRYLISNWIFYSIDNRVAVDHVGKFENLNDDLNLVCQQLGIPNLLLLRTKSNPRKIKKHYSQILNQESRSLIEEICSNELLEFNYKWEDRN